MVIPWQGFPLASLLKEVEPTSAAKYVRFEALYAPDRMPGQRDGFYSWPYVEGLRLDEAMNDLALMVTGLYGMPLPAQDGAPIRLVVPWKYGFKGIKAITKIDLVDVQPVSLWMNASPEEYGFYANVNPEVPHPRWSAGHRAPHWRARPPNHTEIQRLRRRGFDPSTRAWTCASTTESGSEVDLFGALRRVFR